LGEDKNEEKREIMIDILCQQSASLRSFSDHSKNSQRLQKKKDNDFENRTLARANYIGGKQLSERKMRKTFSSEHGRQDAIVVQFDVMDSSEPDKDIEPVGYESLVPAMEAIA
jgi:hypothetical protein